MVRHALPFVLAAAILVAGCGRDGTAEPEETTSTGSSGRSGPGVTVGMQDFAFEPEAISVTVDEQVTWRNDDAVEHDVKGSGIAGAPQTDPISQGETYTWKAPEAGKVSYLCTIHPNMVGTIVVEK